MTALSGVGINAGANTCSGGGAENYSLELRARRRHGDQGHVDRYRLLDLDDLRRSAERHPELRRLPEQPGNRGARYRADVLVHGHRDNRFGQLRGSQHLLGRRGDGLLVQLRGRRCHRRFGHLDRHRLVDLDHLRHGPERHGQLLRFPERRRPRFARHAADVLVDGHGTEWRRHLRRRQYLFRRRGGELLVQLRIGRRDRR